MNFHIPRRYIHNLPTDGALHTEPPIKEEQLDDYVPMSMGMSNIIAISQLMKKYFYFNFNPVVLCILYFYNVMYYLGNNNNNTEGYISMAPTMMSSSAPTRPSIFLHLNSVDPAHTSSLSHSSQANDYMEMKSPMGECLILFSEIVYESNINNNTEI